MIFSTGGIVLKTIKYGETSIIATIFTEKFGVQTYLVNGVRTQKKTVKAHFFQPSSLLELEVYHNEFKNLQRIKEVKWSNVYKNVLSDVTKHSVALFMVELLYKCLKQPEPNESLFGFCEDAFLQLDISRSEITANFALYFGVQLPQFFGFQWQNNFSEVENIFDFKEGKFVNEQVAGPDSMTIELSFYFSELARVLHPVDLTEIALNRNTRLALIKELEKFYAWNISDFGKMKTPDILHEVI